MRPTATTAVQDERCLAHCGAWCAVDVRLGLRNRAVHTSEKVDLSAAREAMRDIDQLLARLDVVE